MSEVGLNMWTNCESNSPIYTAVLGSEITGTCVSWSAELESLILCKDE